MKAPVMGRLAARLLPLALSVMVLPARAAAQEPEQAPVDAVQQARSPDAELGRGKATWYGAKFQGRRTSSGERFDMNALTAAHESLPFGTRVLVRNLANGREVVVRINDRAPPQRHRIIDLSKAAAAALGMLKVGAARVVLLVED